MPFHPIKMKHKVENVILTKTGYTTGSSEQVPFLFVRILYNAEENPNCTDL
jgi:hypothetical protein